MVPMDNDQINMDGFEPLKIKIFADGANLDEMKRLYANPMISGFTTNPTLMRKAGVTDYKAFARDVLKEIPDKPVSFEVFSDDFDEMIRQAEIISGWGENIFVKIPVSNTRGDFSGPVIMALAAKEIMVNVTAITMLEQVERVADCLDPKVPAIVSVFAGRVADTGVDPVPIMRKCRFEIAHLPKAELLWASPREILNIIQADSVGCHIITVTSDLLKKIPLIGRSLEETSLETVRMFRNDSLAAGYRV